MKVIALFLLVGMDGTPDPVLPGDFAHYVDAPGLLEYRFPCQRPQGLVWCVQELRIAGGAR